MQRLKGNYIILILSNDIFKNGSEEEVMLKKDDKDFSKQAEKNCWVHLSCALWIPEVEFLNFPLKQDITGIDRIAKERFKETCSLCNLADNGPTVKCKDSNYFL